MSPRKIISLVLLAALAVGNSAQGANVTVDQAELQDDLLTCWIAGYSNKYYFDSDGLSVPPSGGVGFSQCLQIKSMFHGARRSDWIEAIWTCAKQEKLHCAAMLAFIKENWGVEAALGHAEQR